MTIFFVWYNMRNLFPTLSPPPKNSVFLVSRLFGSQPCQREIF